MHDVPVAQIFYLSAHKTLFMKKTVGGIALVAMSLAVWSCSDNSNTSSTNGDSGTTMSSDTNTSMSSTPPPPPAAPFSKDDSMFVMDAAMGGMTEVQTGTIAQQNAASQRVKDFGAMMAADHGKANSELMSLVAGRLMIPDSLPASNKKHVDMMTKMMGKSFDSHYISMMMDGHKSTIAKFEKEAQSGTDPQLKAWAASTLPTLQKHLDSLNAIKKGM